MTRLTQDERKSVAEGIIATGNLCLAGLLVGQIFPGKTLELPLAILGIVLWGSAYGVAIAIMKGGGRL